MVSIAAFVQRILRDEGDADNWLGYGTFCFHINDLVKVRNCYFMLCLELNYVNLLYIFFSYTRRERHQCLTSGSIPNI